MHRRTALAALAGAATAPALALYCVFNDGPGKTVYAYDRMVFDFPAVSLQWTSGTSKSNTQAHRPRAVQAGADASSIAFERAADGGGVDRHTLELSRRSWKLEKAESPVSGAPVFRNRHELVRSDA